MTVIKLLSPSGSATSPQAGGEGSLCALQVPGSRISLKEPHSCGMSSRRSGHLPAVQAPIPGFEFREVERDADEEASQEYLET